MHSKVPGKEGRTCTKWESLQIATLCEGDSPEEHGGRGVQPLTQTEGRNSDPTGRRPRVHLYGHSYWCNQPAYQGVAIVIRVLRP